MKKILISMAVIFAMITLFSCIVPAEPEDITTTNAPDITTAAPADTTTIPTDATTAAPESTTTPEVTTTDSYGTVHDPK